METVFLDANVLWTAAFKEFSTLRHLWNIPGTRLVTSEYAAEEARRNLENYPASAAEQKRLLMSLDALLLKMAVVPTPYPLPEDLNVNLPAKDIPILAAALSAKAAFLITGDKQHFGAHFGKKMRDITILRPADYLKPWTLNCGRHLQIPIRPKAEKKQYFHHRDHECKKVRRSTNAINAHGRASFAISPSHPLTFLLHYYSTDAAGVTKERGASHSFELRVLSFELGVLMTPCVAEGGAFQKPEGRGDAKGRAEESRGNFKF